MSVYDLPTQVTPIFNPLFWEVSDVSLTRQEADDLYLSIFGGQTVPQVESFASGIETNIVEPFGSANTVLNFTTTGNTNFGGNVNIPSGSFYKINNVNLIPSVSGQSGKYLGTDGSQTLWQTVDALPSQTGQSGRYLTTDGSSASWGTVSQISASGSAGYIQYKGSDGNLAGSDNLFWDAQNGRLGIGRSDPEESIHTQGTIKAGEAVIGEGVLSNAGMACYGDKFYTTENLQCESSSINSLLVNKTDNTTTIWHLKNNKPSIPAQAILYKDAQNNITGDSTFTWTPDDELLYVEGAIRAVSTVISGNFIREGGIGTFDLASLGSDALVSKSNLLEGLGTKQETLTTSSDITINSMNSNTAFLLNDAATPNDCVLFKNSSDQVVGQSNFTYSSNNLTVNEITVGRLNANSIVLSGSPQSGTASTGSGIFLATTNANTGFLNGGTTSTNYTSTFTIINWQSVSASTISGLTNNSSTGIIKLPIGGLYSVNVVIRWTNYGGGFRISWIYNSQYPTIRFSEQWANAQNSTSQAIHQNLSTVIDLRSATTSPDLQVLCAQTSGTANVVVTNNSHIYIVRLS
jgi:hypothetical protein